MRRKSFIIFFVVLLLILVCGIYFTIRKGSFSPLISSPTQPQHIITPTVFPQESQSKNIVVTEPLLNQHIRSPFTIAGEARVFESQLHYRLRDGDGKILVEDRMMANAKDAGQFGPFSVSVFFSKPKASHGIVEVFDYSAKDGSEIDKVIIPVFFVQ